MTHSVFAASLFGIQLSTEQFIYVVGMSLAVVLFAIVFHEVAHGLVALWNGDPTARYEGRLSLNPVKHLDPIGSVLVPIISFVFLHFPFGWARPVPVNPLNFRRRVFGDITVSLAGVTANFLFALALGGLLHLTKPNSMNALVLYIGISLNCALFVFNLLPVPPLDGSHVFKYLLPARLRAQYMRLGMFGYFILMMVLFSSGGFLFAPATGYLWRAVMFLSGHGW